MSLVTRAEAFLHAVAVRRGEAVGISPADALADLIVAYEERLAIILESGDIAEAEAHRIATAQCGAPIAELRAKLTIIAPDHEVFAYSTNLTTRTA